MKELTMKEKIDKVLDKRDEMESLRSEFAPFMESTISSQLVCLSSNEEVSKFANELGQVARFEDWSDNNYIGEYRFEYRGIKFYNLIEKELD